LPVWNDISKVAGVLAGVCGISNFANADGYGYAPRPFSWTGFYVGVDGGYGWNANDVLSAPPVLLRPQGGFGGGQIGYNWQTGPIVFGAEADFQGSGIEDQTSFQGVDFKSNLDWFGTVRGRFGYAFGSSLLYPTGGFAYGNIDNEISPFGVTAKNSGTATGWVVGGGWEYLFSPAWSAKVEYQYIDLGRNDPVVAGINLCTAGIGLVCHDDAFHTVRAGLNFKFGADGYAPLK
jgi:outer membrane immunogenic protein